MNITLASIAFDKLTSQFPQRQDQRQKEMGLQYMRANTEVLAQFIVDFAFENHDFLQAIEPLKSDENRINEIRQELFRDALAKLRRVYAQEPVDRNGSQYMSAETHDMARITVEFTQKSASQLRTQIQAHEKHEKVQNTAFTEAVNQTKIDYFKLQEYANLRGLPYNELCSLVQNALIPGVAGDQRVETNQEKQEGRHAAQVVDARKMGEVGAEPTESERELFEAWMRGHCWKVEGDWNGHQYVHESESNGSPHGGAMRTRQLFAAWKDRGALGSVPMSDADQTFLKLGREMYAMTSTVHSPDIPFEEQCALIPGIWQNLTDDANSAKGKLTKTELEKDAANLLFALHDAWPYVHQSCSIESVKKKIQKLMQKHGEFADLHKELDAKLGKFAAIPEGFKLVPVEPTELMIGVAERLDWSDPDIRANCINQWQSMVAVAPQPVDVLKPTAYVYEVATARTSAGEYCNWQHRLTYTAPNVPEGSLRNLRALCPMAQFTETSVNRLREESNEISPGGVRQRSERGG